MLRIFLIAIYLLLGFSTVALSDWAYEKTSPICSDESRTFVADIVRSQIESSVLRSEASIQPPQSIEELSCLKGLMSLSIANFSSTGSLDELFKGALDQVANPDGKSFRQFCSFAEREWRKNTRPLSEKWSSLPSYFESQNGKLTRASPPPSKNLPHGSSQKEDSNPKTLTNSLEEGHEFNTQNQQLDGNQSVSEIWQLLYGKGNDQ